MIRQALLLLVTLLLTTQKGWTRMTSSRGVREFVGKKLPWVGSSDAQDYQYILRTYHQHASLRSLVNAQSGQTYQVNIGSSFIIASPNFPGLYPGYTNNKWTFEPASGVEVNIHCPIIRVQPSYRCKKDKFITLRGKKYRRGTRRCGHINDYTAIFQEKVRIAFKSNTDNKESRGFYCYIRGTVIPTTTTTLMPGCHIPLAPSTPTAVASCSDLDPAHSSMCSCTDCSGEAILTCEFCTLCDFDIFAAHNFSLNVVLEAHFNCSYPMDVSGYFHANADKIRGLKLCVDEGMSHITFPFSELTALTGLYYQDCSNTTSRSCAYDPCSPGDVCQTTALRREIPQQVQLQPQTRTVSTYPVSLPTPSQVPNLLELHLAEVNLTLTSSVLGYTGLQKLCVNSPEAKVVNGTFSSMTVIQQVYVEICESDLVDGSFAIPSNQLKCLQVVDFCVHSIQKYSISLDAGCSSPGPTVVTFTTEQSFIQYIPRCPFLTLLQTNCVHVNWVTQTDCRACGGYWYWGLTTAQVNKISNQCLNSITNTVGNLSTYVNSNSVLPMCDFPVVPC